MSSIRTLGIVAVGLVVSTHALESQDQARYRDYRLGGDLASISAAHRASQRPRRRRSSSARR